MLLIIESPLNCLDTQVTKKAHMEADPEILDTSQFELDASEILSPFRNKITQKDKSERFKLLTLLALHMKCDLHTRTVM